MSGGVADAVHANLDRVVLEHVSEVRIGELPALVSVEDARTTECPDRFGMKTYGIWNITFSDFAATILRRDRYG